MQQGTRYYTTLLNSLKLVHLKINISCIQYMEYRTDLRTKIGVRNKLSESPKLNTYGPIYNLRTKLPTILYTCMYRCAVHLLFIYTFTYLIRKI